MLIVLLRFSIVSAQGMSGWHVKKIKVMVIDDSSVVRKVLSDIIKSEASLELVAVAADPIFAMRHMEKNWPDVIVLDVEMPRMDGITFTKKLMSEHPTPIVICSTLTERGAQTTMEALAAGAVDIITKPKVGLKNFLEESAQSLLHAIKSAARANVSRLRVQENGINPKPKLTADAMLKLDGVATSAMAMTTEKVVAIGASTGGTHALEYVLTRLPRVCPGIVIVQHMPAHFTAAFASRLNAISEIEIKEAEANDTVLPGRAIIAPGGMHMMLKRSGAKYVVEVADGPLVSRHKPSVDVLFRSVAKFAGKNALGIIMTGMGDDGASGMLEMKNSGAQTIGQNEESCVVYGMPKEAFKKGAVDRQLDLKKIPSEILLYHKGNC